MTIWTVLTWLGVSLLCIIAFAGFFFALNGEWDTFIGLFTGKSWKRKN
jgi:hypothetical protein